MEENVKNRLISGLLDIAEKYLKEMDQFYPFGLILSSEGQEVVGLLDSDLEELPDISIIQERITKELLNALEKPGILGIGMAIHTQFKLPKGETREPIEIRLLYGEGEEYFTYFELNKKNNKISFFENKKPYL
jgi:hypothetical protein